MSSVLVGMFDSSAHAAVARERLLAAGFDASAVSSTDHSTAAATGSDAAEPQGAIARFFSSIFGESDHAQADGGRAAHTSAYAAAFERGACGVAVNTADDAEMDKAAHILKDCGAVDIDEKTAWWRDELRAGAALGEGRARTPQDAEGALPGGLSGQLRGGLRVFPRASQAGRFDAVPLREDSIGDTRSMFDGEPLFGTPGRSGELFDTDSGGSENRDPLTGERGAHPLGTGVGAAAGGIAAAALAGSVVGPIGTVVGAALGAIAGGLAGKDVAEMTDPTVSETKNKP